MEHPNKEIMNKLIELSKEKGVVSAIIVKGDKIISTGFNTVKRDINSINHAEMNAIKDASKKLNSHKLTDCWLYSIFEPCPMCASACIWARMKGIIYGANMDDKNKNYTQRVLVRCEEILEKGTPRLELHKDFMRTECKEILEL